MRDGKIDLYLLEEMDEARGFIGEKNFESAINILKDLLNMIAGDDHYYEQTVNIYKLLGLCYRKLDMHDEGIQILNLAEELCKKIFFKRKDKFWQRELAVCYVNKAIIYDSKNFFKEAITYYESAIIIFEELKDDESKNKVMLSLELAYNKANEKIAEV